MDNLRESTKRIAKSHAKKIVKKKMLSLLVKTAPIWGPVFIVVLFGILLFAGFYGAMADQSDLDGDGYFTEVDNVNKQIYIAAADKYSGEPISVGELEKDHVMRWGLLYGLDLFETETKQQSLVNTAWNTAKTLQPYFTYKDSTIIVVTKRKVHTEEGIKTKTTQKVYHVKLLMVADTYKGLYTYRYERRKETTHPDKDTTITITKDYLVGYDYKEDWTRLEDEMRRRGLLVNELERKMLLELANAFIIEDIAFEWLYGNLYAQQAGAFLGEIPAEYLKWFKEAGEEYGIPWYILAAICKTESPSFDPNVVGSKNHTGELAQGLMQFLPSTWAKYGVDADGDGEANPFSPKDAIFSAANYLKALGINENMKKAIWGYNHSTEYVQTIIDLGNSFKAQDEFGGGEYIWPVATGDWSISSPYGPRVYDGNSEFHDGLDIACRGGTAIMSIVDGVIETKGWHNSYGNRICIRGIDGNLYLYAHMSEYAEGMRVGLQVKQGTILGKVGSTGRSSGNHLHLGVQAGGRWIDPMLLYR